MRTVHRWIMLPFVIVLAYLAVTGLGMQGIDILALLMPGAGWSQEIASIREGPEGPPFFTGMAPPTRAANDLPVPALATQLSAGIAAARAAAPEAAITSVELRELDGTPQAVVTLAGTRRRTLLIDTGTGAVSPPEAENNARSLHDSVKAWHRGNIIGTAGIWINALTGVALLVLCVTGVVLYFRMLAQRKKIGRTGLLWK
jgi:uncharacterized iron-regulated membrane protein